MFHVSKGTLYISIRLERRCLLLDYSDCEEILLDDILCARTHARTHTHTHTHSVKIQN
jgi:hypothetical protein